jgi:DNA polymerase IV
MLRPAPFCYAKTMAASSPLWPRVIVHADMDAFYASVEQLHRPELRGKPLLVGGTGARSVVCTASYEARPFGCKSAMPMAEARRRCPQAVVIAPDFGRYQAASDQVMAVFRAFSPLVEPLSLDEAFLDMTGAEGLFGCPEGIGQRIRAAVLKATGGLTVSVGIAATKFVAKVASDHRKPDGLTVVLPGKERDFLWPMDVSRLWGVGPKTKELLDREGFQSIGDVARASEGDLHRRFGALGDHIHALAWARDDRQVVSERDAKSVGAEVTLEKDVRGAEAILPHLRNSAERVGRHLRREGLLAGGIRVKLKTGAFKLLTRQARLSPPTDADRDLLRAAKDLLLEFDLSVPMRLVGLAAFDLAPAGGRPLQPGLFEGETREKTRNLDRTLDSIRRRFGDGSIHWGGEGK